MIEMISDLINKGFAYEENQHVYFEVKNLRTMENFQIKILMN